MSWMARAWYGQGKRLPTPKQVEWGVIPLEAGNLPTCRCRDEKSSSKQNQGKGEGTFHEAKSVVKISQAIPRKEYAGQCASTKIRLLRALWHSESTNMELTFSSSTRSQPLGEPETVAGNRVTFRFDKAEFHRNVPDTCGRRGDISRAR